MGRTRHCMEATNPPKLPATIRPQFESIWDNRKALEAAFRYLHQQGLAKRELTTGVEPSLLERIRQSTASKLVRDSGLPRRSELDCQEKLVGRATSLARQASGSVSEASDEPLHSVRGKKTTSDSVAPV